LVSSLLQGSELGTFTVGDLVVFVAKIFQPELFKSRGIGGVADKFVFVIALGTKSQLTF
jgi:hypothetical protein